MNKTAPFACLLAIAATTAHAEPPPGFARLADNAPDIAQDMRYAGPDNFTGHPVPGYRAPQCWLRAEAARALADAQADAKAQGFSLAVYDCYRPMRAVASFVEWSRNADQTTKPAYYPRLDKSQLFAQGYIAAQSTHSTGLAVDLGVVGWNFGTPFDFFDPRSWTKSKVAGDARAHRDALVALMKRHGFENYPREWWHYAFKGAGDAARYDLEIE
ncbi:M15 family metallopeptidase [Methylocystis sp. MJC1]|jgi:D-alanyl-D-alanine dipeptidase|uniref:M15 family metallopeptidase n=1 Tax=Methylocystis sp. MJC1 TaxID=2654282 RepID=UPI0013EA44F0|nr:M15 family metallopeptidase [Methylocystis sp. MJC1]KAF2992203.1 D-alanyl-D-alanine dipeptidase [Methylocystis sp. MJC1]MBU6527344.1 peptidase M15 [Methylocystis sp. MJC1]UZX10295.1 M15 family metallopeptidase [Methylocystis sp. MJC1]